MTMTAPSTAGAGAADNSSAHATPELAEAARLMTVCNSCRYCEGICAVFPAMEQRRVFTDGDLRYLANLCHACGACYADCQFAPPHEFAVNVPQVLAKVRNQSYADYTWPTALAPTFHRNGVTIALVAATSVAAFIGGFVALRDSAVLFGVHSGPGAFYRLMPHDAMAVLFGLAFLYAVVALAFSIRNFWRGSSASGSGVGTRSIWQATKDAGSLRYLDGGGDGCGVTEEIGPDRRRHAHHATFYGFLLCFASTSVATLYHFLLGREAPYPWWDLPVVLGTVGGIGIVAGPLMLLAEKARRAPVLADTAKRGMEIAFLLMLFLTGASGLALLVLRETAAMGILLAVHLGVVFALFLTMPYGKFVHGLYRFAALVKYSYEMRAGGSSG